MDTNITIFIILNERANRIDICSARGNGLSIIRNKLSGINRALNDEYSTVISSSMKEDIKKENRNIADKIYKFSYNENDLTPHVKSKLINVREDIKAYIIKEFFNTKDIYSISKRTKENTLDNIENSYEKTKGIIKLLFKSNTIKIDMSINNTYSIMKSFHWLSLTHDSIKETTKENKVINIIPDNINERIKNSFNETRQKKLLEIECILRGIDDSNELINSLISDKAKKIYELTVQK